MRSALLTPALALATLIATAAPAAADDIDDLRRENARLRAEVDELRARLEALSRDAAADGAGEAAEAGRSGVAGAASTRGRHTEPFFVPRTRVTLEIDRDASDGTTSIATLWLRTSESGPLPRREWFQVRAKQAPSGEIAGSWMVVERQGGGAGAKVDSGRFTVDGRVVECPAAGYESSQRPQAIGPIQSSTRHERIRFSIPREGLDLLAGATRARFDAGPIGFELSDEHLAAFAAVAARAAGDAGS
jgi:hypothetical protein